MLQGGDPLGLTGMGDIIATPDLSGFRVVSVSNEGIRYVRYDDIVIFVNRGKQCELAIHRHKFATINEFEAAA